MYTTYKKQPSFVLGFHGCDKTWGEKILAGKAKLNSSANDYDWLGTGIYFWESNPTRALKFAQEAAKRPELTQGKIRKPFVLGAIIDLGICCNLHDQSALDELKAAYTSMKDMSEIAGTPMPQNKVGPDKLMRHLDCAVINYMHTLREVAELPPYDSVRAAFHEGGDLYPESGFTKNSHVQIALRSEKQILGYFRVRP